MEYTLLLISLATSTALIVINFHTMQVLKMWRTAAHEWQVAAERAMQCAELWQRVADGRPEPIIDVTPQESGHSIH